MIILQWLDWSSDPNSPQQCWLGFPSLDVGLVHHGCKPLKAGFRDLGNPGTLEPSVGCKAGLIFALHVPWSKVGVLKQPPKKKEVAYFGTWKFGCALRFLTLPVLFWFPLPFGLNLATLQLCAWCMFLSYTNSWGALIVGPGLLLTFTIFSHHSFKCTDPTTRVRGCVIMDLWVHARVESKVGLYNYPYSGMVIPPWKK